MALVQFPSDANADLMGGFAIGDVHEFEDPMVVVHNPKGHQVSDIGRARQRTKTN